MGQEYEDPNNHIEVLRKPASTYKGVICVAGGVCLMIYLGCFFLWSNISVYVISYFHYVNDTSNFSFVQLVDTLLVLFIFVGNLIGTYLF